MSYDRNPKFGEDRAFADGAKRVTDLLWETTGGDLASFPKSYLENLRHEYAEGNVSMLELIDRVNLGADATYEDYCEEVDALMEVNPDEWPSPDAVVEVPAYRLQFEIEPEVDFSEFDFADELIEEEAVVESPNETVDEEEVIASKLRILSVRRWNYSSRKLFLPLISMVSLLSLTKKVTLLPALITI